MAETTQNYVFCHETILVLTTEVTYMLRPKFYNITSKELKDAAQKVSSACGIFKESEIAILHRFARKDDDFNAIHSSSIPEEIYTCPVVIEFFFPDIDQQNDKESHVMYGHIRTNLYYFDGYTAIKFLFNVIEYLEHHYDLNHDNAIDTISFNASNVTKNDIIPLNWYYARYVDCCQLYWTLLGLGILLFHFLFGGRTEYIKGPMSYVMESKLKPSIRRRFPNAKITYPQLLKVADQIKKEVGIPWIAYTINYSPKVALGFLQNFSQYNNRDIRLKGRISPIFSPPPMNLTHCQLIGNAMFFNNYGRIDPKISATVTGFVWDWTNIPKSFPIIMICMQIGKRLHVTTISPEPHWRLYIEKILTKAIQSEGEVLTEAPKHTTSRV